MNTERTATKPTAKIAWRGTLLGVQPRIRLIRSFDQRSHTYQGYVLRVSGTVDREAREFVVAIGETAHARHEFRIGDEVSGVGHRVNDTRTETAEFYKMSKLELLRRGEPSNEYSAPWHGVPPELLVYRERGHRRLAAVTYERSCQSCIWGCKMAVEIIVDQWKPSKPRYRTETFCYGPRSCPIYKPGPTRKAPGRRGMTYEEEDWVDEETTSHRAPDE